MTTTRRGTLLYLSTGVVSGILLALAGVSVDDGREVHDWCAQSRLWCLSLFAASGAVAGWVAYRLRHFRARGAKWNLVRWVLTCTIAGMLVGSVDSVAASAFAHLALGALLGLLAGGAVWATQEYLSPSGEAAIGGRDER
jgi:membrane associated rhomboid family serine protease